MIKELVLENFKSIHSAHISLRPFNVLVGANGSGKSNLIKALEFLGDVARLGTAAALGRQGGFESIVPKILMRGKVRGSRVRFSYSCQLHPPHAGEEVQHLQPLVEHSFTLGHGGRAAVRVTDESLLFRQVGSLAKMMMEESGEKEASPILWDKDDHIAKVWRGERGAIHSEFSPPVSNDTIDIYLAWLGFPFFADREGAAPISHKRRLMRRLAGQDVRRASRKGDRRRTERRHQLFIDPDATVPYQDAGEYRGFRMQLEWIRRYDLLLSELRREQAVGTAAQVSRAGENVPSVLRSALADLGEYGEGMERLRNSLGRLAPHVEDFRTKTLRSGKEFVEFIESKSGRGVESWESSDGTLRALAILLAVETHPRYGSLLIEEPEQNLHPWAVRALIEHVRAAAQARDLQILMTTHSQQVLEAVAPDEVLVTTRDPDDGTRFMTLEESGAGTSVDMGDVGRLWVKGLLGGVPGEPM